MNTKIKNIIKATLVVLIAVLITNTTVNAIGTLTPSGTAGEDTQYSLNDIYNKITNINATSSVKTAPDFDSIAASFRTLSEIWGLLETAEDVVIPENIKDGVTVFGVEGDYTGAPPSLEWSTYNVTANWATAISNCAALTEGGATAGDWRLPTIQEYQSITDFTLFNNATAVAGFTQSAYYWSSTPSAHDPDNYAWGWYAYYGRVYVGNKTITDSVRCVR